jgi:hypothetical protein
MKKIRVKKIGDGMFFYALLVILIGAVIALYEVPKLRDKEMRGELIAFSAFLLVGVALALAVIFDLPVPNPTHGIEYLFKPIARLIFPEI